MILLCSVRSPPVGLSRQRIVGWCQEMRSSSISTALHSQTGAAKSPMTELAELPVQAKARQNWPYSLTRGPTIFTEATAPLGRRAIHEDVVVRAVKVLTNGTASWQVGFWCIGGSGGLGLQGFRFQGLGWLWCGGHECHGHQRKFVVSWHDILTPGP